MKTKSHGEIGKTAWYELHVAMPKTPQYGPVAPTAKASRLLSLTSTHTPSLGKICQSKAIYRISTSRSWLATDVIVRPGRVCVVLYKRSSVVERSSQRHDPTCKTLSYIHLY